MTSKPVNGVPDVLIKVTSLTLFDCIGLFQKEMLKI